MDEKLGIDKQANLMFVQKREQIENAIQREQEQQHHNDGNLLNPLAMEERLTAYEAAHEEAARRMGITSKAFHSDVSVATNAKMTAENYCHVLPPAWPTMPNGWWVSVDSSLPRPLLTTSDNTTMYSEGSMRGTPTSSSTAHSPMVVSKTYSFLDQPATYKFIAMVAAAIEELGFNKLPSSSAGPSATESSSNTSLLQEKEHPLTIPKMEWMWSEVTVTMLSTPQTYILAQYLNDTESKIGTMRNQSAGGIKTGDNIWSKHLNDKIQARTNNNFMWMFNDEKNAIQNFIQSTYVQWSNRAEYLIARKSRERREFRQDLTLSQTIQQGAERKRRAERRKFKDKIAEHGAKALGMEKDDFERYSIDVLPREMREQLDEDRSKVGGMREFEHRAGGLLAFSRSTSYS